MRTRLAIWSLLPLLHPHNNDSAAGCVCVFINKKLFVPETHTLASTMHGGRRVCVYAENRHAMIQTYIMHMEIYFPPRTLSCKLSLPSVCVIVIKIVIRPGIILRRLCMAMMSILNLIYEAANCCA